MVPAAFTAYFTAAAAAAGVLIGLLFVAVSLRPETVFGEAATSAGRAQAGSAFTCLADCFFLSIVALIPDTSLGIVAIVTAVSALWNTLLLHRQVPRRELQTVMLTLSLGTYLYQLVVGIMLTVNPANHGQVYSVAYLEISLFSVALGRAWDLVQGKHILRAKRSETTPGAEGADSPQSPGERAD